MPPLRYYVPFIPAYILLTIEWLNTISIEPKEKNWNMITLIISAALFGLAIIYSFVALKLHEYIQLRYLIVISIFIILLVFYFKQKSPYIPEHGKHSVKTNHSSTTP